MRFVHASILVAVTFTIGCNAKWSYSSSGGQTTITTGSGQKAQTKVTIKDNDSATTIQSQGRIELAPDDQSIISVSEGGYLRIQHSEGGVNREVEVVPDASGEPTMTFKIDGTRGEFDAEAREWYGDMLDVVIYQSSIVAGPRAERLLRDSGPHAVLEEIPRLSSGSVQQRYIRTISQQDEVDADVLVKASQVAAEHVESNSSLRKILVDLSGGQTEDEQVSLAIIQASESLSSNSDREKTLLHFAEKRSLSAPVAVAALESASKISSDSSKTDALVGILNASPPENDVQSAYVDAVDAIASANRREEALIALLRCKPDSSILVRIAEAVGTIPSSSSQEDVLVELIRVAPADHEVFDACLRQVSKMSSTSNQEDVIETLLKRRDLDQPTLSRIAEVISGISSSNVREDLRELLDKR